MQCGGVAGGGAGGEWAEFPQYKTPDKEEKTKTTGESESDSRRARPPETTMTSYVQADKLQPTDFEVRYFDDYDYYNLTDRYALTAAARKGRTKKEARENTNKDNPAGHERKIAEKLQKTENKKKTKPGKE
ncbi:nuclear protein 2-like [Phyllobates terribilis]|uniref:nuclear protein 2-like n=1 Tax=Phyllobates terribilis TaxID=111132 RepID=UPI003CCAD692